MASIDLARYADEDEDEEDEGDDEQYAPPEYEQDDPDTLQSTAGLPKDLKGLRACMV
jgi:hypothetical protein